MNKISILFFLFLFIGVGLYAQENTVGKLSVYQDYRVDTLISKYIQINALHPVIEGWRIEIFFEAGNYSKKLAMEAKAGFVEHYPNIPCYLIFQQPYYKVRVGDFRTKMEAEEFLYKIEFNYPQAFVVMGEINFPQLD